MKVTLIAILAAVLLSACSTTGVASQDSMLQITSGMSREQVIGLLGAPGNRSFQREGEALQYCHTGFLIDYHSTVWLVRGVVVSLTTSNVPDAAPGLCTAWFPEVDWGQIPADVRIAIERK